MAVTLEELQIRFTAQMGSLNTQLNGVKKQLGMVSASAGKAQGAMSGLARTAKLFIGAYLVRGLYKIGKASLEMANDVVESESLFQVSMKGMADDARAWSDNLSNTLGLNAYSLRKNVGIFNTMFSSMGLGTDKAYELSTGLVELAEDMASFYNMDSTEAFDKLRAGITGETEPLKRLGILVDENTTKQYALSEGISNTGKDLTQTQKLLARYAAIMAQTADAQGDLARTIDSPVNQIRLLKNTLDMAKISLGQAFQPIQAMILPILHSLAQAALTAANALKSLIWALTGFKGIGVASTIVAGAGADANGELADSLEDSADAYKKAGGAAKKASKDAKVGLKAFDEINKLTEESAEKGGGGAGLAETPEIIEPEQVDTLEVFNEYMSEAADWLKKVWEIALPTREALGRLWDKIKESANIGWDNLVLFYEKVIEPLGKWAVTKGVPAFLDALSAAMGVANTAALAARPVFEAFYNDVLKPLGEWAGQAVIDALGWLKDRFNDMSTWIKNNKETFEKIVEVLVDFGAGILTVWAASSMITNVTKIFGGLKTALSFFTSPTGIIALIIAGLILLVTHWDEVKKWAVDAWEKIKDAWGKASAWFDTNVTQPVVNWFKQAWEDIKGFFINAWATVSGLWSIASGWFNNSIIIPIVGWFKQAWEDIKGFFANAWAVISGLWSTVSTWFYNSVIKPIIDFFASIGIDLPGIFSSAWAFIQSIWVTASTWFYNSVIKPIQDAFETAISTITGWWNDFLKLFGLGHTSNVFVNVHETIIKKVIAQNSITPKQEEVFNNLYKPFEKLNLPPTQIGEYDAGWAEQFPGNAKGGVFPPNKPFLGFLGDQTAGMNIEAPENLLRTIVHEESRPSFDGAGLVQQAVAAVMDKLQINLNVDGQTFGKATIRAINNVQRNAGTVLLEM